MNEVKLRGSIRDINYSHTINDVRYGKANLIVPGAKDEDIISLVYKEHTNHYKNGDFVELSGNLRSYSQQLSDNKNKVSIYVFTYFDIPKFDDGIELDNFVHIDGRICKIDGLREHSNGIPSLSFVLANNIFLDGGRGKINNYIPVISWGVDAEKLSKHKVGDKISILGKVHSRTYKKYIGEDLEIRTAHELVLNSFEEVE